MPRLGLQGLGLSWCGVAQHGICIRFVTDDGLQRLSVLKAEKGKGKTAFINKTKLDHSQFATRLAVCEEWMPTVPEAPSQ